MMLISFTDALGREIAINVERIAVISPHSQSKNQANIWFSAAEDDFFTVEGTVEQVWGRILTAYREREYGR
jgi:hypothetical protein